MARKKRKELHIGAHISTRKGFYGAAVTASAIGAGAFQYFPKNPRSLILKTNVDWDDARRCAEYCREKGLLSIGHAPYPLNPAAEGSQQDVMVEAMLNALEIVDACGSVGLVVHFGKFSGKDPLQGYKNIIQCTNKTLSQWRGSALLLLENQAGSGSQMGTTMEELARIRQLSDYPDKIAFCLDTCHAFAAGLWHGNDWDEVEQRGAELGYFDHLKAVHLNDSLYPHGSGKDRHANIGEGYIGLEGFKSLLASDIVRDIPLVLETGSGPDGTHREEIALVKRTAGAAGKDT
ncbi:deoxyribonuclease IV [Paenibacillus sp. 1P03SA]|uniref:deoxyribonuclease IV n=1 Tax=Paenibacillus sp. 1P03SA TaxID=3132294 RepID=UPI0039A242CB